jgi:hypothetical protein
VTRFSVLLVLLLVALDLSLHEELGVVFDLGFVAVCAFMAMSVRPEGFFRVGVLPPMILFALCCVLAPVWSGSIAEPDDGVVQAVVSGLAHRSGALCAAYALTLGLLAVRHRVIHRRAAMAGPGYSNRAVSPAPRRTTSGTPPSERSTTVVGSDPHSPESSTASSS